MEKIVKAGGEGTGGATDEIFDSKTSAPQEGTFPWGAI
jgi:hypothetical protein